MQVSEATPTSSIAHVFAVLRGRPCRGRRSTLAMVLVAAFVLPLLACGNDDEPENAADTSEVGGAGTSSPADTSPPSTGPTDSTPVEPATDEEQVLAAVQCYWDTLVDANSPPDPDHPGFARCFTGRALETAQEVTLNRASLGQVVSDEDGIVPKTVEVLVLEDRSAKVRSCQVDDGILMDGRTGLVLNDGISTHVIDLTLLFGDDGAWRVEYAFLAEKWEGDQPCP